MSERAVAEALGLSRNAVRRHLAGISSNDTKAPTGSEVVGDSTAGAGSRSRCEPFREVILSKLAQGLDSQRIFQDLVEEHGFGEKYWSVHRFVKSLGVSTELPFRRIEVEPGWELQVDFGAGRQCPDHEPGARWQLGQEHPAPGP